MKWQCILSTSSEARAIEYANERFDESSTLERVAVFPAFTLADFPPKPILVLHDKAKSGAGEHDGE